MLILLAIMLPIWTYPPVTKTGIVIGTTQSTFLYESTYIKFATFSDSYSSIKIEGIHELNIEHKYKITTQQKAFHIYLTLIKLEDLGETTLPLEEVE